MGKISQNSTVQDEIRLTTKTLDRLQRNRTLLADGLKKSYKEWKEVKINGHAVYNTGYNIKHRNLYQKLRRQSYVCPNKTARTIIISFEKFVSRHPGCSQGLECLDIKFAVTFRHCCELFMYACMSNMTVNSLINSLIPKDFPLFGTSFSPA